MASTPSTAPAGRSGARRPENQLTIGLAIAVVHEGHDQQHGEQLAADQARVEADLHHDQLHQAARVHQRASAQAVAPVVAACPRAQCGTADLAHRRDRDDQGDRAEPDFAEKKPPGRRQAGQREEQRHQHDHRDRLDPLHQRAQQPVVPRQAGPEQEGAEHRMQVHPLGEHRAHQAGRSSAPRAPVAVGSPSAAWVRSSHA